MAVASVPAPFRKPLVIIPAVLAVLFVFWLWETTDVTGKGSHFSTPTAHQEPQSDTPGQPWQFVPSRDASASLSRAQCDAAFPRLFQPIEDVARARKDKKITLEDIDIPGGKCMLRALIYDNELFVIDAGDPYSCHIPRYRERIVGYLGGIYKAITTSRDPVPNVEFSFTYADKVDADSSKVAWIVTKKKDDEVTGQLWLMPDYGYWAWGSASLPSYTSARRKISEVSAKRWSDKIDKAVWRGNVDMSPLRGKLFEASKGKSWSDIKHVTPKELKNGDGGYLTVEGLCEYKYLIQTEGMSYSGRLKYLQLCNSVTVAHQLEWLEFHTHLMQPSGPEQNFIEVDREWSNLELKMEEAIKDPQKTEEIATRSFDMFNRRYLTPAAIDCYWRRLIETWAKNQGFQPQLYVSGTEHKERTLRGVPFENFVAVFPNVTMVKQTKH